MVSFECSVQEQEAEFTHTTRWKSQQDKQPLFKLHVNKTFRSTANSTVGQNRGSYTRGHCESPETIYCICLVVQLVFTWRKTQRTLTLSTSAMWEHYFILWSEIWWGEGLCQNLPGAKWFKQRDYMILCQNKALQGCCGHNSAKKPLNFWGY